MLAGRVVKHIRLNVVVSGHSRPGEIQDNNDCLLPWCYGIHPHVRYHQRGLLHCSDGLVHPDTDLLVGQHPSHSCGQQVRHGRREGSQDCTGQRTRRSTQCAVLRIKCKGSELSLAVKISTDWMKQQKKIGTSENFDFTKYL